jgi:hypothetical protein
MRLGLQESQARIFLAGARSGSKYAKMGTQFGVIPLLESRRGGNRRILGYFATTLNLRVQMGGEGEGVAAPQMCA